MTIAPTSTFLAAWLPRDSRVAAALVLTVTALVASACGGDSGPGPTPVPNLVVTCPSNADVQSTGGPVVVTYPPPVSTGGAQPVTTTCSPPSGSPFEIGSTRVTCQARDAGTRTATCEFTVTVRPPPELRFTEYLAFGDSLTWGVASLPVANQFALLAPEPPPPHAYPNLLEQRLVAHYRNPVRPTVLNAGIGGEQAAVGGIARFRNVLLAFTPEVVLLMEGTNDLLRGQAGADDAIAALGQMVDEAKAQGRAIALATIPPQRQGSRRPVVPLTIPDFNDRIRALAASKNVPLVDVYDAMKDDMSLIGQDDLHPTVRGFELIAETFYAVIEANYERTATAMVTGQSR
jgi:lysophospholipase L1-like esterase